VFVFPVRLSGAGQLTFARRGEQFPGFPIPGASHNQLVPPCDISSSKKEGNTWGKHQCEKWKSLRKVAINYVCGGVRRLIEILFFPWTPSDRSELSSVNPAKTTSGMQKSNISENDELQMTLPRDRSINRCGILQSPSISMVFYVFAGQTGSGARGPGLRIDSGNFTNFRLAKQSWQVYSGIYWT